MGMVELIARRQHYCPTQNNNGSWTNSMIICIKWIVDVTMVILTRSKLILSKAVDESIMLWYIHLQEALETIRSESVQWIYCQPEKSGQ